MSNANRSRTDKKPCQFDGSTERDSNGQCHCRNVLYRLTHRPNLTDEQVDALTTVFNRNVKKDDVSVDEARVIARDKVLGKPKPPAAKKAAAKKAAPAAKKAAPAKRKAPAKKTQEEPTVAVSEPESQPEPAAVPAADFVAETAVSDAPADALPEHKLLQTQTGLQCACGYEGKGTAPSIRSHIAREGRAVAAQEA